MKVRIITGAVLALVFVPLFVLGGIVLNIGLAIVTMAASYELFRLYNTKVQLPSYIGGLYVVFSGGLYLLIQQAFQNGSAVGYNWIFVAILFLLIFGSLLVVFIDAFDSSRIGEFLFSIVFPSIGFGTIYALRNLGLEVIGFLFLITIATDVFAYIVGINFGKHRLAIKISPKKSIEGSIGGTFFALVFTLLYIWLLDVQVIGNISLSIGVSIGLIVFISVIGQIGDLVASKLKRTMGIKDFSNIFPGHGGVMDRFDSALFAAMVLIFISEVVGLL